MWHSQEGEGSGPWFAGQKPGMRTCKTGAPDSVFLTQGKGLLTVIPHTDEK